MTVPRTKVFSSLAPECVIFASSASSISKANRVSSASEIRFYSFRRDSFCSHLYCLHFALSFYPSLSPIFIKKCGSNISSVATAAVDYNNLKKNQFALNYKYYDKREIYTEHFYQVFQSTCQTRLNTTINKNFILVSR